MTVSSPSTLCAWFLFVRLPSTSRPARGPVVALAMG